MNEKWLTRKMRKGFKTLKLRSFESCRIPSVPDLLAILPKDHHHLYRQEFWIEAKLMKDVDSNIPWSGGQLQWIKDYENDDGIVFIVSLIEKANTILIFRAPRKLLGRISLTNPAWSFELENLLIESL